jgi:hypothetical protein
VKKTVYFFVFLLVFTESLWAQIVTLKSGKILEGKILEQTDDYIKIDVDIGIPLTYFYDQIESIRFDDGSVFIPEHASPRVETVPQAISPITSQRGYQSDATSLKGISSYPESFNSIAHTQLGIDERESLDKSSRFSFSNMAVTPKMSRGFRPDMNLGINASALGFTFFGFYFILIALIYAFFAYCLQRIAVKSGIQNAWLAWLPIVNLYLMCKIAGRPGWWMLFLFIPFVSLVFWVIINIGIAQARAKSPWFGLLLFVPIINLFAFAYLAFVD